WGRSGRATICCVGRCGSRSPPSRPIPPSSARSVRRSTCCPLPSYWWTRSGTRRSGGECSGSRSTDADLRVLLRALPSTLQLPVPDGGHEEDARLPTLPPRGPHASRVVVRDLEGAEGGAGGDAGGSGPSVRLRRVAAGAGDVRPREGCGVDRRERPAPGRAPHARGLRGGGASRGRGDGRGAKAHGVGGGPREGRGGEGRRCGDTPLAAERR